MKKPPPLSSFLGSIFQTSRALQNRVMQSRALHRRALHRRALQNRVMPSLGSLAVGLAFLCTFGFTSSVQAQEEDPSTSEKPKTAKKASTESIILGGGCFWCVEAVFEELDGVLAAESGYEGGHVKNPTYRAVCEGTTGHAEVVKVIYDPKKISLEELLDWFWQAHDPTTLNRQGADRGTQYRSVIFYQNEEQRVAAIASKKKANESGMYKDPIVTEISAHTDFFLAEKHHQNYFALNPTAGYCRAVIQPKMNKLFKDKK